MAGVSPDAAPKHFEHMLATMSRLDTDAPDLEKPRRRMARDQWSTSNSLELPEASIGLGHVLPQQAIDPDKSWRTVALVQGFFDDEELVAHAVELADIAAKAACGRIGDRSALLKENSIAQSGLGASSSVPARRASSEPERAKEPSGQAPRDRAFGRIANRSRCGPPSMRTPAKAGVSSFCVS